jgi:hypothetical protein
MQDNIWVYIQTLYKVREDLKEGLDRVNKEPFNRESVKQELERLIEHIDGKLFIGNK